MSIGIEEINQELLNLEKKLMGFENDCFTEMSYCRKHNYNLEAEALRYRQEAFNKSWLEVFSTRDRIIRLWEEKEENQTKSEEEKEV